MIYKEISYEEYWNLRDQTGAYLVLWSNGDKAWYLHGKLHREDGPAYEGVGGTKFWCLNGLYHREDGPAVEWLSGTKEWILDGNPHREDGPAIEWANGTNYWYLNDRWYETEEEWRIAIDELRTKEIKDLIV